MKFYRSALLLACILFSGYAFAQPYSISQGGTVDLVCGTIVSFTDTDAVDDNYAGGEMETMTFCPTNGNSVSVLCAPNENGNIWDIADGDALFIYNGDDDTAPLLGVFNSITHPDGFSLSTTLDNASGCMTFVFQSNSDDVEGAGWTSDLSCGLAWQPFTVALTTDPEGGENQEGYVDICQGEEVTFTCTGDYPFAGQGYEQSDATSNFEWDFGDGEMVDGVGLTSVSHTFPGQFGYFISCKVTDSEGQIQIAEYKVRVSTTPSFQGTTALTNDTICLGNEATFLGGVGMEFQEPFGFEPTPTAFVGGGFFGVQTFLPDGSNDEYETSILIDDFPEDAVIENVDDIIAMCVTMEHSFLGDLEMMLTCPDGTSINIFNSYTGDGLFPGGFGGGGTFLGAANDDGSDSPGEGFTYCFTGDATTTFEDANGMALTPVTFDDGNGNITTGNAIPAGNYAPEDPLSNFIGCPINGEWTITVRDNLFIDNGYIFNWAIQFNPLIDPTAEFYQPGADDYFWADDPTIVFQTDTFIRVFPPAVGAYDYSFHITDNFGCDYDTTLSLTVIEPHVASVADEAACGLTTGVEVQNSYQGGVWSWTASNEEHSVLINPTVVDESDLTGIAQYSSGHGGNAVLTYSDNFCNWSTDFDVFFRPLPIAEIQYNDDTLALHPDFNAPSTYNTPLMYEYDSNQNYQPVDQGVRPIEVNELIDLAMGSPAEELTLSAQDALCPGVISTATVPIVPEGCFPYTVFSPNGDGMNDAFYIGGVTRLRNNSLRVYNRWGNLVYEKRNYQNDWEMEDLVDGTYFFTLTSDSKGGEFNGSFTVIGSGK